MIDRLERARLLREQVAARRLGMPSRIGARGERHTALSRLRERVLHGSARTATGQPALACAEN